MRLVEPISVVVLVRLLAAFVATTTATTLGARGGESRSPVVANVLAVGFATSRGDQRRLESIGCLVGRGLTCTSGVPSASAGTVMRTMTPTTLVADPADAMNSSLRGSALGAMASGRTMKPCGSLRKSEGCCVGLWARPSCPWPPHLPSKKWFSMTPHVARGRARIRCHTGPSLSEV